MAGELIPVLDLEALLGLPLREQGLNDALVVVAIGSRRVAFVVCEVMDVREHDMMRLVAASDVVPEMDDAVEGYLVVDDGTLVLHDLPAFVRTVGEGVLDRLVERATA